jgi:hypothetical protein
MFFIITETVPTIVRPVSLISEFYYRFLFRRETIPAKVYRD